MAMFLVSKSDVYASALLSQWIMQEVYCIYSTPVRQNILKSPEHDYNLKDTFLILLFIRHPDEYYMFFNLFTL